MIRSLRAKLLLGTVLVIVLVMAAVVVVVEHTLRVAAIDEMQHRGEALARNLAATSYGPLLLYNFTALEQNVVRAAAEPDAVYAVVLDADGKVAAHSRYPERVGLLLPGAVPERAAGATEPVTQETVTSAGEAVYDFAVPILVDGRKWGTARLGLSKRGPNLPASTDEFGSQVDTVRQARNDREAILKIMERVPASERKLLPDVVVTVDALLRRAEELARMLQGMSGDVDEAALRRLEDRIDAVKRHEEGTERERQLNLLERQRQALGDLLTRRRKVEEQIESCVMAMQNVRFDLLRLRSAGVAAVLSDLTNATQQARALSRDVDHAIAAADEIQDVLGERPRP